MSSHFYASWSSALLWTQLVSVLDRRIDELKDYGKRREEDEQAEVDQLDPHSIATPHLDEVSLLSERDCSLNLGLSSVGTRRARFLCASLL